MPLFHEAQSTSFAQDLVVNRAKALYLFWPVSATVINTITKLYSLYINTVVENQFVHFQSSDNVKEKFKFTFSINTAYGLTISIMLIVLSSFAERKQRLLYLVPFQITILSVLIPIFVIKQDPKIKLFIDKNYLLPINFKIQRFKSKLWKCRVEPIETLSWTIQCLYGSILLS